MLKAIYKHFLLHARPIQNKISYLKQEKKEANVNNEVQKDFIVEMKGIVKDFGSFRANDHIDLQVLPQEVHAILGENGAGKSTLMNILYGLYHPTEGQIFIRGQEVKFRDPNDAIAARIGMVHQHFMLIPTFTVLQNIILGTEPTYGLQQINIQKAKEEMEAISAKYDMKINLDALIEDISVGMQQRVEILKVLYRGADILILDEPTAALTPQEILELMNIIRFLVAGGKTVIIITHKLKEIKQIADRCTIIRRGKWIDTVNVAETDSKQLANLMVGREVNFRVAKEEQEVGDTILEVKNLKVLDYRGLPAVNGLDLQVKAGEIVGLAGVDGNGQSELVEALVGLRPVEEGHILLKGEDVSKHSIKERFVKGLSCIPEDRQKHGLVLEYTVAENLVLQLYKEQPYSKKGFLNLKNMLEHAECSIEDFDIRPDHSANLPVGSLSGGNQQKVIIAREVQNNKDLLIAVNPTRGLDVGAIEFIHAYLVEQRNKGKAVLLISFEIDEILNLSDRVEVIYEGRISGSADPKVVDDITLGLLMAGGHHHEH